MKKLGLFLIFFLISSGQSLRMKRVAYLLAGPYIAPGSYPISVDSDHDSLNEIIFLTDSPTRWEVWEHCPMNQYHLVYADTGIYPYPPGITTGNFEPKDVGDIDQDSLVDLLGPNYERTNDSIYNVITTQESPNYSTYPESLTWWYRFSYNEIVSEPFYFPGDLDNDNRREILFHAAGIATTFIIENIGNNQNEVVFYDTSAWAWSFTFGDFDLDNRQGIYYCLTWV
jgi:hypothetical protein